MGAAAFLYNAEGKYIATLMATNNDASKWAIIGAAQNKNKKDAEKTAEIEMKMLADGSISIGLSVELATFLQGAGQFKLGLEEKITQQQNLKFAQEQAIMLQVVLTGASEDTKAEQEAWDYYKFTYAWLVKMQQKLSQQNKVQPNN